MKCRLAIAFAAVAFSASAQQQACPATTDTTASTFTPPAPYSATALSGGFLFGADSLWTLVWNSMSVATPPQRISKKLYFLSARFEGEAHPDLKVVARRLDAPAPPIQADEANSTFWREGDPDSRVIITGTKFTEAGCWQIIATYKGYSLGYVVAVSK